MTSSDVSVVIPVRNRPEVLRRAIESALAQTAKVLEIIVVDDGSTDHTPETALSYAEQGAPVRLIRQPTRGGAPIARNRGASEAKGQLLAFLDSDDAWAATKIETQLFALQANRSAVGAFTNIRREYRGGGSDTTTVKEQIDYSDLQSENILGSCSTALIYKSAFDISGQFDQSLPSCQDWDLWLKIAKHGSLFCCSDPLTTYYFDGDDRISTNTEKVMQGHAIVFDRIYDGITNAEELKRLRSIHKLYLAKIAVNSLQNFPLGLRISQKAFIECITLNQKYEALRLIARAARKNFNGIR